MIAPTLTRWQLVQYGLLAIPVAFAGFPLYVLAPDFYAAQHGVSLTVLGVVLLCLRMFDAIQDPLIGRLSDRFPDQSLVVMTVSAVILVASIYMLFNPGSSHVVGWFAASMACAVTAYSILNINMAALGALWTPDAQEQTRISSTREGLGLIGLLLAVSLPPLLIRFVPQERVFTIFSLILAGLAVVALLAFRLWFRRHARVFHRNPASSTSLFTLLSNLPSRTRHLFAVYGLSVLASSIPAILVIFFVRDRLDAEQYLGMFLLLYFLSGALTMPVWKHVSIRHGKHRAWLMSMVLAVVSFVGAFCLGAQDVVAYAMICVVSGMALGADLVLPASILAEDMHHDHSQQSAATQFSILTLLGKIALALSSAIAFPLLDWVGFVPASLNAPSALWGLSAAYALIPCLIKLLAAYFLYRLFIQPKGHHDETFLENHTDRSRYHVK